MNLKHTFIPSSLYRSEQMAFGWAIAMRRLMYKIIKVKA
ncbi:MAG: hypothetical protein RLZZ546_2640 [Bacteroidota bacterium]|jgi:hypothetical protein